jgi:hypothetical protein
VRSQSAFERATYWLFVFPFALALPLRSLPHPAAMTAPPMAATTMHFTS